MNKTELVAAVAEKAGLSKKDAEKAVAAVIDAVVDTLKAGEKVQLVGFGTFEVKERAAREGVNPATGAKIKIELLKLPLSKQVRLSKTLLSNLFLLKDEPPFSAARSF